MEIPAVGVDRRPVPRFRGLRARLSTVFGLVVVLAVIMAVWANHRQASVPWEANGGMIGWTETGIVARLGLPSDTYQEDVADSIGHHVRPSPPSGPFRTLVFQSLDGQFVAWFTGESGTYTCFRSTWVERNRYY